MKLDRYGRLEPIFGWQIVRDILDAVAANLGGMVGSTLRRLDVVADFTLTDDAFIVLLSPPRSAEIIAPDDLALVTRRVYERLQSLLLNDLAPGVYDRVHPSVGAAILEADDAPDVRAEPAARGGAGHAGRRGAGGGLRAGAREDPRALRRGRRARAALRAGRRPRRRVPRSATAAACAGPFYAPLRLPDVLLDVVRRSGLLSTYGVAARAATVEAAAGLQPDDLLFVWCAAAELPNAAVVALSEFYSLNQALVPQHVVFEIDADELRTQHGVDAAHARQRPRDGLPALPRRAGGAVHDARAHRRSFAGLPVPRPGARRRRAPTEQTSVEVVQLLVRFAGRIGGQLIATGVRSEEQEQILRRNGVELFCGELYARPDARLPQISFTR